MTSFISDQTGALIVVIVSVLSLIGSVVLMPLFVLRLPPDYFLHQRRPASSPRPPLLKLALLVSKNVLGASLLVSGVLMLVLPGQGLLTILAGMLLLDFPGKFRFERRLASLSPVRRGLNWLRHRAGAQPFLFAASQRHERHDEQ